MMTLDDVIEAMERCETYPNCHFCYLHSGPMCEWIRDALHYLKEFQGLSKMWNDKLDKEQENDPLSWDELQQMAGKPVYITFSNTIIDELVGKGWFIIHQCFEPEVFGEEAVMYCNDMFYFPKKYQGTRWQAYRKQR